MKQTSWSRKSNLITFGIIGVVCIIIGIGMLIYSNQEAEPGDGWSMKSVDEIQEELDNYGIIGGIVLTVGIVIVVGAFLKNQSNSKISTDEAATIDRYEKRLKDLHNELKENKITQEEYTNKKSVILNNIVSEVYTLDLLKKRLKEMTIEDLVTDEEVEDIIKKIDKEVAKAKRKRTIIIAIIVIIFFSIGTINRTIHEQKTREQTDKARELFEKVQLDS